MDWSGLAKKLAAAGLPVLGGSLAGPFGAAAGAALAARLGIEETPEAVARYVATDPLTMLELRRIEAEMQADENATETQQLKIEAQDRQDARVVNTGHWLTPVLTLILILMVVAIGAGLFIIEPPAANRDLVNVLLGNIMGWASAAVVYWLGSSRGSADRAATIDQIAGRK